jgi:hypothetical protein
MNSFEFDNKQIPEMLTLYIYTQDDLIDMLNKISSEQNKDIIENITMLNINYYGIITKNTLMALYMFITGGKGQYNYNEYKFEYEFKIMNILNIQPIDRRITNGILDTISCVTLYRLFDYIHTKNLQNITINVYFDEICEIDITTFNDITHDFFDLAGNIGPTNLYDSIKKITISMAVYFQIIEEVYRSDKLTYYASYIYSLLYNNYKQYILIDTPLFYDIVNKLLNTDAGPDYLDYYKNRVSLLNNIFSHAQIIDKSSFKKFFDTPEYDYIYGNKLYISTDLLVDYNWSDIDRRLSPIKNKIEFIDNINAPSINLQQLKDNNYVIYNPNPSVDVSTKSNEILPSEQSIDYTPPPPPSEITLQSSYTILNNILTIKLLNVQEIEDIFMIIPNIEIEIMNIEKLIIKYNCILTELFFATLNNVINYLITNMGKLKELYIEIVEMNDFVKMFSGVIGESLISLLYDTYQLAINKDIIFKFETTLNARLDITTQSLFDMFFKYNIFDHLFYNITIDNNLITKYSWENLMSRLNNIKYKTKFNISTDTYKDKITAYDKIKYPLPNLIIDIKNIDTLYKNLLLIPETSIYAYNSIIMNTSILSNINNRYDVLYGLIQLTNFDLMVDDLTFMNYFNMLFNIRTLNINVNNIINMNRDLYNKMIRLVQCNTMNFIFTGTPIQKSHEILKNTLEHINPNINTIIFNDIALLTKINKTDRVFNLLIQIINRIKLNKIILIKCKLNGMTLQDSTFLLNTIKKKPDLSIDIIEKNISNIKKLFANTKIRTSEYKETFETFANNDSNYIIYMIIIFIIFCLTLYIFNKIQ